VAKSAQSDWEQRFEYDRPRVDYSGTRPHPADEIVERLAWLMDNSIRLPGGYTIGIDPIVGLIPGIGDLLGGLVSAAIIVQAHRAGVPRLTVLRMLANVGIDTALGALPVVGDFFDFAFKSNARNIALYRQTRAGLQKTSADVLFLVCVLLALAAIVLVPLVLAVLAFRSIFSGLR